MAKITALIHARNQDASRLERSLASLKACDQVLVVNYHSSTEVEDVTRARGATALASIPGVSPGAYLVNASHDWVLCLYPFEELSQALTSSLRHWKDAGDHEDLNAVSVAIREEMESGWINRPPETRLVNRNRVNWTGDIPPYDARAPLLSGELLRYHRP
jgi:hypothetical protein